MGFGCAAGGGGADTPATADDDSGAIRDEQTTYA
jgi:hypothetical protein